MTVTLRDFWTSHRSDYVPECQGDVAKEFLKDLANQILTPENRPIVITSVYKTNPLYVKLFTKITGSKKSKQKKLYQGNYSTPPNKESFNIWYTAENIRPPLDAGFDAFLSFDLDTFMGVNHYLPLWLCRLGPTLRAANEKQLSLTQKRQILDHRTKNFAAVISNPEQIRGHFISSLRRKETVEIFGKLGNRISNKDEALSEFNFNICFENDIYPGYVTEKAIEAYMSGCIPVWRGCDAGQYLNKEAIVDVTDMSLDEAVLEVHRISKDFELMAKMRSAPLLRKTIDLKEILLNLKQRYQET